jgi:hypothetical protein
MNYVHARMKFWLELSKMLYEAAELNAKALRKNLRPRRKGSYAARRPGADTPMWNLCALALRAELKPHGAKVRLARFLGTSKQRMSDFLAGRRRLPDAELTLQLLNWLAAKKAGRDLSL